MNLSDVLEVSAERFASRPAVMDVRSGRSLTYEQLAHEADRVRKFLLAEGVEPCQRIALVAPNSLAYLPAAFGLLATGACLVPLPANLTDEEESRVLREIDVNGTLVSPDGDVRQTPASPVVIATGECAGFRFQWQDRDAPGALALPAMNPAFIRFSSGTTARSKGVVLSHEATAARVEAADRVLRLTPDDRILWVLPLAYHFAVTIVGYVRAGAHVLLCPDTLPVTVLDAMHRLEATVFYASPLHFERLGHLPPGSPLRKLRLAMSTSAPISAAVMDLFESVHGVPVAQAYGIIEAGLPCINLRTDGLPATSVGRPVPGYEIAVFSEHGARVEPGSTGDIGVRGPGLFSAYYSPWRRREDVTRDGFFPTGDVGRLDEGGALHLLGRKKTVIFVAGVKFFPEEVEECINRFPGVRESRVFGAPHAHLGQVPHAEIVPGANRHPIDLDAHRIDLDAHRIDLDALRAHCARALSAYKVPQQFTVVPAIAKTPGGKIVRR